MSRGCPFTKNLQSTSRSRWVLTSDLWAPPLPVREASSSRTTRSACRPPSWTVASPRVGRQRRRTVGRRRALPFFLPVREKNCRDEAVWTKARLAFFFLSFLSFFLGPGASHSVSQVSLHHGTWCPWYLVHSPLPRWPRWRPRLPHCHPSFSSLPSAPVSTCNLHPEK